MRCTTRSAAGWLALPAVLAALGAGAQEPAQPESRAIWPAGLEKLTGSYRFLQVASPGGLWETLRPAGGAPERARQVSLGELPPGFRERLTKAEIVISDLKLPSEIEASERPSPSGRGRLRFYSESAMGMLKLSGIPGIGGGERRKEEFSGPVVFTLDHQSHSNPSVSGIFQQRLRQEATWGAATLDYADFHAIGLPPPDRPDAEGEGVIINARVLRSGVEIFAFVEWTEKNRKGDARITGSIRLVRKDLLPPEGGVAPLLPRPDRPQRIPHEGGTART